MEHEVVTHQVGVLFELERNINDLQRDLMDCLMDVKGFTVPKGRKCLEEVMSWYLERSDKPGVPEHERIEARKNHRYLSRVYKDYVRDTEGTVSREIAMEALSLAAPGAVAKAKVDAYLAGAKIAGSNVHSFLKERIHSAEIQQIGKGFSNRHNQNHFQ